MAVTKVSPASSYQVRYNHGNRIDCSGGAVFARRRGLGILSLARELELEFPGVKRAYAMASESLVRLAGSARDFWSTHFAACGDAEERLAKRRNPSLFKGGIKMKPSTKDEIKGKVHEVKGKVKEKVGRVTSNPDLEAKGQDEKVGGKIQKKIGQVEKVFGK